VCTNGDRDYNALWAVEIKSALNAINGKRKPTTDEIDRLHKRMKLDSQCKNTSVSLSLDGDAERGGNVHGTTLPCVTICDGRDSDLALVGWQTRFMVRKAIMKEHCSLFRELESIDEEKEIDIGDLGSEEELHLFLSAMHYPLRAKKARLPKVFALLHIAHYLGHDDIIARLEEIVMAVDVLPMLFMSEITYPCSFHRVLLAYLPASPTTTPSPVYIHLIKLIATCLRYRSNAFDAKSHGELFAFAFAKSQRVQQDVMFHIATDPLSLVALCHHGHVAQDELQNVVLHAPTKELVTKKKRICADMMLLRKRMMHLKQLYEEQNETLDEASELGLVVL